MLVCFGDSLTATADAWPTLLTCSVVNVAVVGAVFADLPGQLDRAPSAGDAAVVTVGTNDTLRYTSPLQADVLLDAAAELRTRYGRVVLVDALLPWKPRAVWLRDLGPRRRAVRAALRSTGLEVLPVAIPPWGWRRDAVHPNARGQRRIADAVEVWLRG